MKFSTREDIEAPIEFVFERLSDFEGLERQAMRRGLEVQRKNPEVGRAVGAIWAMKVPFRGRLRDLTAEVKKLDNPGELNVFAKSGGLNMDVSLELLALSPARTRLVVGFDVRPDTLSARILLQSVKFAKATLQRRFKKRIAKLANYIETQYQDAA